MGRQAYLDKIAFGRSAFEPTQSAAQSTEYVQLQASQSELPRAYTEATANNYVQLFDERGSPINPRSHGYGKRLRDAQNDVLASVGVVERRRRSSEDLAGTYGAQLELLEAEDTVGNAIALASTLTENLCTWWIGSIRQRILTFRYHDAIPYTQIIQTERAISSSSLYYAGFASQIFPTMSIQAIIYGTYIYQPISRLLYLAQANAKTRNLFRRWRQAITFSSRLALEILFYPFFYRSSLERLGLVSVISLVPSWNSVLPTVRSSLSLHPFSVHHDASASVSEFCRAVFTSPVLYVCVEHLFERWVYASVSEAVDLAIIRPDNPEVQSRDDRSVAALRLKNRSPPLIRNAIKKFLSAIGWAQPSTPRRPRQATIPPQTTIVDPLIEQAIDVGGTRVTDLAALDIPMVQALEESDSGQTHAEVITIPVDVFEDMIRPTTPPTPTAPDLDLEDNDPRIRITSREGIVEMEVRLPPRILSTHTEVVDALPLVEDERAVSLQHDTKRSLKGSRHRVTQLSSEPAQMIGAMVKAQLVGIVMLPIKMFTLRMIASHYLVTQDARHARPIRPLLDLSHFSWRSLGVQVSRVALCGTLELSIDLALWGVQCFAITQIGKHLFDWGLL